MDIPRYPVIGGKLFDQGMYGCMFAPALHCKYKKKLALDDTKPEDNVNYPITKIILKEDAEMEYSIGSMIRRIPLWKELFLCIGKYLSTLSSADRQGLIVL